MADETKASVKEMVEAICRAGNVSGIEEQVRRLDAARDYILAVESEIADLRMERDADKRQFESLMKVCGEAEDRVAFLEKQRDDLQAANTREVEARRTLTRQLETTRSEIDALATRTYAGKHAANGVLIPQLVIIELQRILAAIDGPVVALDGRPSSLLDQIHDAITRAESNGQTEFARWLRTHGDEACDGAIRQAMEITPDRCWSIDDGKRCQLSWDHAGACDLVPWSAQHPPNGQAAKSRQDACFGIGAHDWRSDKFGKSWCASHADADATIADILALLRSKRTKGGETITSSTHAAEVIERDILGTASAPVTIANLRAALSTINDIRNSIIGFQNVGWSKHIYPLVAALNKAGFEGMGYEEARAAVTRSLEEEDDLRAVVSAAERAVRSFDAIGGVENVPCGPMDNLRAALAKVGGGK